MSHTDARTPEPSRRPPRRGVVVRIGGRGFTLAELLVAVGLVAVLTLGIGRIFSSVSKLVGTGAAVGEVDQIARVLEAQLRADFAAANRLNPDENFLAIRCRRVGDLNGNGTLDTDEVDIYISRDDEEADRRRGVDAYQRKPSSDVPVSLAINARLDQIMFLGAASQGYRSFQPPPASEQVVPHALIMWGHGLRPPLDAEDPDSRPRYRLNYPDGDFGFARGDDNPFAPDDSQYGDVATGRNRYAGNFILTRRAVLLAGGSAAGEARIVNGSRFTPLWGKDTEFAFLPRDVEASYLFANPGAPIAGRIFGGVTEADEERASAGDGGPDGWAGVSLLPNPRLLRHGRTDILAVDRQGLQQWIEGIGVPFSTGRLGSRSITDPPPPPPNTAPLPLNLNLPNARLWVVRDGINAQSLSAGSPAQQYEQNLRGVQSGIAGMFHRVLVDPYPPTLRVDPEDFPDPPLPAHAKPDATDRRMDLHAVIASRCSSFEVAWSDGSTWVRDAPLRVDANGDGIIDRDIRRGDTIWFDMDFTVRDFWRVNGVGSDSQATSNNNARIYPRPNPDPEIGLDDDRTFDWMPNRFSGSVRTDQTHEHALEYRPSRSSPLDLTRDTIPGYSPFFNHAPFTPDGTARPEQEYLAIWGFRTPEGADQGPNVASVGGYDRAWPKPRLIRIRMTIHDSQNRLEGGKRFEFVFRLSAEGT